MAAAAGGASASAAGPGVVLDDRYHLAQVRAEHRPGRSVRAVLWRAVDEPLDRDVAVLVVTGLDTEGRDRFVEAATSSTHVTDSRFVRVLDVGDVELDGEPATWVATEWVDAPSLTAIVRSGPLPAPLATELVRQCAEAIEAAARADIPHGHLHPDQVLLPPGGLPRITGLGTAAALHEPDESLDDVRALAGLLYTALTGHWPLPGWRGLPAVDERVAQQGHPRLVRAGIDRELDSVVHRGLTGGFPDARSFARALGMLPTRPLDAPETAADPTRSVVWQRWAWRIGPPLVVLAIGLTGWAIGSDLGRVPTSARHSDTVLPPKKATAPGSGHAKLVWHRPPEVTGFDPEGDREENDDQAPLAVDVDGTTAWTTSLYRDDSHFGGLKSGVGLLLDLGRAKSVRLAELALTAPGSTVEIRAGDRLPQQVDDLPLIDTKNNAGTRVTLNADPAVRAQYWLVWFTNLPPADGGYRVGVAEVTLLG